MLALALAYRGRGLGRASGTAIIAGYLAFVTALVITVEQGGVRPAAAVAGAGALLLTWPAQWRAVAAGPGGLWQRESVLPGWRIPEAFAAQAAAALRQQQLAEEAERTRLLAEAGQVRTALLSAVSHDLHTPLSSAMVAVESLANPDITWTGDERAELVATARESLERLQRLVANLLDMSRLQAGVLGVHSMPLALEEIIPRVLDDLGPQGRLIRVSLPDDLPEVLADPPLLERILASLLTNAVRYSPVGEQVLLTASGRNDRVDLRIVDRGPGIPPAERDRVFQPFQRLGDRDNHTGVGLGLALALGLTEVMNGTLVPDDTPGGGLTMIITLPAAATPASEAGGAMPGIRPPAQRSPALSAPGGAPPGAEPLHNQPVSPITRLS